MSVVSTRSPMPIDDATRRRVLTGGAALLALAACGRPTLSTPPAADTRTVDHALGTSEVPIAPQRIVALDAYATLQVLDELGAPLVAAGSLGGGTRVLVSDRAAELPSIGVTVDIDLEAVAAARPDLIIGFSGFVEDQSTQLNAIAPTVAIDGDDWREVMRATADATGLRADAELLLGEVEQRVAELADAVRAAWPDGVRVSVLRVSDPAGGVLSYTSAAAGFVYAQILTALGVTIPADTLPGASPDAGNVELSAEQLARADADVVLFYAGGGASSDADVAELAASLTGNPLWPTLGAVTGGRAHQVAAGPWFDGGDTEAAHRVLDDLFTHLI